MFRKKKEQTEVEVNTRTHEFTRCTNYVEHRQRHKMKEEKHTRTHNSNVNMKIDNYTNDIIVSLFVNFIFDNGDNHCSSHMNIFDKHL